MLNTPPTQVFFERQGECVNKLPWQAWGEDYFMGKCLDMLGVPGLPDFTILGDNRCTGAVCGDGIMAAYHPFKDRHGPTRCRFVAPKSVVDFTTLGPAQPRSESSVRNRSRSPHRARSSRLPPMTSEGRMAFFLQGRTCDLGAGGNGLCWKKSQSSIS